MWCVGREQSSYKTRGGSINKVELDGGMPTLTIVLRGFAIDGTIRVIGKVCSI